MGVHVLQDCGGRIDHIVKMKTTGAVVPIKDGHGKHKNRPNALSADQKQSVGKHIDAIPKYQSHCSTSNNINKMFLNCDMTTASLYKDYYVRWCQQQNIIPVKQNTSRKIFRTEYNIGLNLPKSDKCKICDESKIKLDIAKSNNDDKEEERLTTFLNLHKIRFKAM
ncbi:unnamed protein product [Acanthoscelides obtectus]|uniref:Uncharacterized protein n=1 Tax=Acanthoscelides obtectus TaxID=200917 RepID=A0A9P0LPV9_ACAOB|nr:unnamed protein product [Acanthoscelides obtectus]CAK1678417.1 hypothetical protein AOBTE_LOCUS31888 [Acanthoscelides obtectus]